MWNEKQMLRLIRKYPVVIVYGAGMVGTLTVDRILANGIDAQKLIIAVSKKRPGEAESLCGIKISEIEDVLQYTDSALVIIATMSDLQEEIRSLLNLKGFEHMVSIQSHLYNNMCECYIQDFGDSHPVKIRKDAKTKIMFMASDNNRTSGAFLCMVEVCVLLKQYGVETLIILPCYGTGEVLLKEAEIGFTYVLSTHWGYEITREHDFCNKVIFAMRLLKNQKTRKKLVRFIQKYGINLVHCNTSYTYIGAVAAKKSGIPVIWHIREDMEEQGYRFFIYQKAKQLIGQSNCVIYVSQYLESKLKLSENNLSAVVYDAVNYINEVHALPRNILSEPTVAMILVGAIAPHKGQEELIDACAVLKKNNFSSYRLLLVGRGEKCYVEELQKQVKLYQLEDNIIFYGQSNEVKSLYEESDISFMCSKAEPYGRVTIEAQLFGCLVIGAASGATTELIVDGNTGLLYEAGNVQALADCISRAISDVERSRRIARSGQEFAQKTYTQQNQLKCMLGLYEGVLERKMV